MEHDVRVTLQPDLPIYRQIVTQLSFMIEAGDLRPGQLLPSARLLAANLQINRNTVARAYAELAELGLVASRGRSGTTVVGPAAEGTSARDRARELLRPVVLRCVELGLTAADVQGLVAGLAHRAEADRLRLSFVECNADRATYFAREIEEHLGVRVQPLVLGEFDPEAEHADLVLTTFYHLAEVRGLVRRRGTDVVAIVVAPHVQTLVQIASVPKKRRVGIWYSTEEQSTSIRDSLTGSGLQNITVLRGTDDADLAGVDLVVIPSHQPELKAGLESRVKVIEFGNVLDAASLRMVSEVVRDLQLVKQGGAGPDRP